MKKKLLFTILSLVLLIGIFSAGVLAANGMTLIVNGVKSDAEIQVINGSSYVPLRAVAELLGAQVNYDASSKTITIIDQNHTVDAHGKIQKKEAFDVNIHVNAGPMIMNISKITFEPEFKEHRFATETKRAIVLDVEIENTSDEKLTWFVDQSMMVLNTKEQIERNLYSDDVITPEFNGKVVKKGIIAFPVNSSFEDIDSIRLLVKYAINDNWDIIADDQEVEIILR